MCNFATQKKNTFHLFVLCIQIHSFFFHCCFCRYDNVRRQRELIAKALQTGIE